jgi:hypothetical protein
VDYVKRIEYHTKNQEKQTQVIRRGAKPQNLLFVLVNKIQAEKRNQEPMGPVTVGEPHVDNIVDLMPEQIVKQCPDYHYLDPAMHTKSMPVQRRGRLSGLVFRRPGIDTTTVAAACALAPEVTTCHNQITRRHPQRNKTTWFPKNIKSQARFYTPANKTKCRHPDYLQKAGLASGSELHSQQIQAAATSYDPADNIKTTAKIYPVWVGA